MKLEGNDFTVITQLRMIETYSSVLLTARGLHDTNHVVILLDKICLFVIWEINVVILIVYERLYDSACDEFDTSF